MTAPYYTLFTNAGLAKEAEYIANGTPYTIAEIAVGDANGSYYDPDGSETSLVNETWRGSVNNITIDPEDNTRITIKGIIPEDHGPVEIREVGLFADDGVLVAIGKLPYRYIAGSGEGVNSSIYLNIILKVNNTDAITINIDPDTVLVNQLDLQNHNIDPNAHFDVTQSQRGFMSSADKVKLDNIEENANNYKPDVGEIKIGIFATAPDGTLKLNGGVINRADYPELTQFAVDNALIVSEDDWANNNMHTFFAEGNGTTTIRLPDWRSEFLRIWDDGRGVDTGRTLSSWQNHMFEEHTGHHTHSNYGVPNGGDGYWYGSANYTTGQPSGGNETRPRNVAVTAVIVY